MSLATGMWAPGRTPWVADCDGNGFDAVLLYAFATGAWGEELSDGASGFASFSGVWSPGWRVFEPSIFPLEDSRADVFLYNESTGQWFRGSNTGPGLFAFEGGTTRPNLDIFTETPALPGSALVGLLVREFPRLRGRRFSPAL